MLAVLAIGHLLISVVIAGLIFWLLWWFLAYIGLPEPFAKVAKVLLMLFAVVFLINLLLSLNGTPMFSWGSGGVVVW